MATARTNLKITGMHCAACAANIERTLRQTEGISKANVNYATEEASVTFDDSRLDLDGIAAAVEAVGYGVVRPGAENAERAVREQELADLRQRLGFALGATALILLLTHLHPLPASIEPWALLA
ncbi:MAG: cation-translocating P-type ATPase, partial [Armatimonadota bacterium]